MTADTLVLVRWTEHSFALTGWGLALTLLLIFSLAATWANR